MTEQNNTVEVAAPAVAPEAAPALTREDLKTGGWSAKEMDAAEKHGMVAKAEEKLAPVVEASAPVVEAAAAPKPKVNGSLPDMALTPEKEAEFLKAFGPGTPPRALYFRMKNERHARQAAEARTRELEAQLLASRTTKPPEADAALEDQPLTLKALKELQRQESEAIAKQQQEQTARVTVVTEAQQSQEEYARTVYPDFDPVVNLAKEVMQNLDAMVPEKWKQAKVVKLVRDLQIAAANADRLGLEDYHAAHIAYEIGQFHPDYGKKAVEAPAAVVAKGALTPEQMKRAETNTQRRASSASVPNGGGKRTISVEEVDVATLNAMNFAERASFREKHPAAYAKLIRG
jgi:hypothetical protein